MSTGASGNTKTIVLGNRPLREYILEAIISINRDVDIVEILGRGKQIHRAVTLYNTLTSRLGDRITLKNVEIGSMLIRGRRVSYIKISIGKK
jgi:DNA-binding protein Alba|uniref:DNA-binding protein n=1 Tax=Ignisphaera aggregans TaxID=334771 RepID=A0A7J2U5N4_9CREN